MASTTPTTNPSRPFITCHVLDTTSGKPAPGMAVTLRLLQPSLPPSAPQPPQWSATTNADGRVVAWQPDSTSKREAADLNALVAQFREDHASDGAAQMVFSLTFGTEAYFGRGHTFWPEVELRFAAKRDEEHYHVPLLLGPWSYTTYRGS